MVDVGRKPVTARRAVASAVVRMSPNTARRILERDVPKGDVLAAARLAGIMAAKKTSELLPLCHPLALTRVAVQLDVDPDRGEVHIKAATEAHDRTGVEMEALTAASVAALTIYDMAKSVDRSMTVEQVMLLEKSGGRSGHYRRLPDDDG
jgi:cyclic pyranopterin phosphate synthase